MDAVTPFTINNATKKRTLDNTDLMTTNKRLNTGFGSPESMILTNDDMMTCSMITTTATPIERQSNGQEYQLSPNATTPAYAPCNTYTISEVYPQRPSTPPFSMTLAHYNESSGGYTSTLIDF